MIELSRILCPVDFSEFSQRALDRAFAVARCYKSTVTALHVVPLMPVATPGAYLSLATESNAQLSVIHVIEVFPHFQQLPPRTALDVDAWMNDARRRLREAIPDAARSQCAIKEAVTSGKPYREILSAATNDNDDLIVIGHHGRGATDRFFFGSTTSHVVREAHCPVLTLRS